MKTREVKMDGNDPFANISKDSIKPMKFDPATQAELDRMRKTGTSAVPESKDTVNEEDVTINKRDPQEAEEVRVKTSSSPGADWIRQDLPSLHIPYSFKETFVKPLEVVSLSKIYAASKAESITLMLDAIDPYINVDVRDLTPEDFDFLLFWLRENSYKKYPHKFPFTTRYGNDIQVEVRMSQLKINELKMTRLEFNEWKAKGVCFPTMRDAEVIENSDDISEDRKWMLEQAQYVPIPEDLVDDETMTYVEKKFEALNRGGIELYENIIEFKELTEHGIIETVTINDRDFVPEKAIEYFRGEADRLMETIELMNDTSDNKDVEENLVVIRITSLAQALYKEADEIESDLAAGNVVTPKPEVVAVPITATAFFPSL